MDQGGLCLEIDGSYVQNRVLASDASDITSALRSRQYPGDTREGHPARRHDFHRCHAVRRKRPGRPGSAARRGQVPPGTGCDRHLRLRQHRRGPDPLPGGERGDLRHRGRRGRWSGSGHRRRHPELHRPGQAVLARAQGSRRRRAPGHPGPLRLRTLTRGDRRPLPRDRRGHRPADRALQRGALGAGPGRHHRAAARRPAGRRRQAVRRRHPPPCRPAAPHARPVHRPRRPRRPALPGLRHGRPRGARRHPHRHATPQRRTVGRGPGRRPRQGPRAARAHPHRLAGHRRPQPARHPQGRPGTPGPLARSAAPPVQAGHGRRAGAHPRRSRSR
ncbi:hypothetical protein SGPA1_40608 [Streptomyces misionensis JCM 4497]